MLLHMVMITALGHITSGMEFMRNPMVRAVPKTIFLTASILVFYAARDKGRLWLYPLAILLHTALDSLAGLNMAKVVQLSAPALEAMVVAFGLLTFLGAYFLLYKKDAAEADN